MHTIIRGALLCLEQGLAPGSVAISDGRIAGVFLGAEDGDEKSPTSPLSAAPSAAPSAAWPSGDTLVVDAQGMILSPGLIDLHCHGGAGADVNDGSSEALAAVGAYHRSHGVTAYAPSVSVDPMPALDRALRTIRRAMESNRPGDIEILGAHFESPYINPLYKGCQAAERLLPFDAAAIDFLGAFRDCIARITVAPELPGVLEAIPLFREWGFVVSLGHSDADASLFRLAVDQGATMATHLYNAMSSTRKVGPFRVPGVLEAALTDDRVFTELIGDGKHVPPELMRIALRCKGPDKFMLCSDANRGAGMEKGATLYTCGQEAIVEDGVAMLKDRSSLASSVTALDGMVRILVRELDLPFHQAIRAASAIPARAIGVGERKGCLAQGYDADLVLWDTQLQVRRVWCRGIG